MSKKINVGILYILPWILGILLLKLFPFGLSLFLSFTSYDLMSPPQFIGISNYVEMFKDELFIKALVNTLKYDVVTDGFLVGILRKTWYQGDKSDV